MSPVEKRSLLQFNWVLLGLTLILFAVGLLNLSSAGAVRLEDGVVVSAFSQKQLIWGCMGLGGMLVFMFFDYRHLKLLAWPAFSVAVVLLLGVLFTGRIAGGARRWLSMGGFSFQPSEVAKIAMLILGAKLLAKEPESLGWLKLARIVAVGCVPALLIAVQPDLGSGLSLLLILGGMILYRGLKPLVVKVLIVLVPCLLPLGWFVLHDYQKQRILTFLDPGRDPLGAGYHIIQSQIAIGSGRLWGEGWRGGSQSQLRFLPEKHTDFAVAVFGEEWGFVGMLVLLSLFCLFLHQIAQVAEEAKDRFGAYLAVGVFFYFFWQVCINLGMVIGLMPVVGIPLPFVSYGGSATLVNFCLLGLVLNVSMRRFVFKAP